ncbi:MAG TPA: class I SAM-dependent methyltransferase [Myxococcales bacterium]
MRIDISGMHGEFLAAQQGKKSRHSVLDRTAPSIWQYDYLALSTLRQDVGALIAEVPGGGDALDIGADKSPYRELLEDRGFTVKTLDVDPRSGADFTGTVEQTGLGDLTFDLVLCTQVLEHCDDPWAGMREVRRILKRGGHALISVPHVWFYHPHPKDHWRFTQEGLVHLCATAGLVPRSLLAQGGSLLAGAQVLNFLAYGVLGRSGAPLFAAINALGRTADRLVPNTLFCHNIACLAQRPHAL